MKWTPEKTMTEELHASRVAAQLETVTGKVGHVLNLAVDVVVGKNCGVLLFFERFDLVHQVERIFVSLCRLCGLLNDRKLHASPGSKSEHSTRTASPLNYTVRRR